MDQPPCGGWKNIYNSGTQTEKGSFHYEEAIMGKTGHSTRYFKKAAEVCSAILAGNMLLGFAVAAFILPSGVIMGGATGVGIVLGKVIPLDTAGIVLGVNQIGRASCRERV